MVSVDAEPRAPRFNAQGLERQNASGWSGSIVGRRVRWADLRARHENLAARNGIDLRIDPTYATSDAARAVGSQTKAKSAVTSSTSTRNMNRIELRNAHEVVGLIGLDVRPHRIAVVDQLQMMFDVTLRAQDQRLRTGSRGEPVETLRRKVVQPSQAIGATDADDRAMGKIHESIARCELPLFAEWITVMRGDAGVDSAVGHHRTIQRCSHSYQCRWAAVGAPGARSSWPKLLP